MTPPQQPTREAVDWSGTVTAMQVRHELLQTLLTGDRWLNICPLCSSEPCRCSTEVWEDFSALPAAYYDDIETEE